MTPGLVYVAVGVTCLVVVVVTIVHDVFIREKLTEWARFALPAAAVVALAIVLTRGVGR